MPKLIIDDREIEVPAGTKVIEAAERLGIMIPRFCYHEAMGAVGACRMCAVKFVQGPFKGVQMSCLIDAQDGMVVSTTDEEAVAFRKQVIEWLMLNHPHDCPVCDEGGQCLLQDETVSSGHGIRRYTGKKRTYRDQYLGIYLSHEMNRCIHCYRCARFYQEFSGYRDLGAMQISNRVYFGRHTDGQLESPFQGNLADLCPTGVYTDKPSRYKVRRWDLQRTPSLCIHCSLGCNTVANAHYRGVLRIEGRLNAAVNGHFICDPGRYGFAYTNGGAGRDSRPWKPRTGSDTATWDEAVRDAAGKLARVEKEYGPGAIGVLGSTRNSLETLCALRRFARGRGWQAPSWFPTPGAAVKSHAVVSRLNEKLAVSLAGIQKVDFLLAVGVDPLNEAPMLAYSMRQAFRNEAPVVVMDPRPVSLPMKFEHIPAGPDSLEACLGAIVRGAVDRPEVEKLDPRALDFYDLLPKEYTRDPGVAEKLGAVIARFRASCRPVIICGTDVVRESTPAFAADAASLLSLVKPDAGFFAVLPGADAFGAALLNGDGTRSHADVLEGIENGSIRALLVVESDPFRSCSDHARWEAALEKLDEVVVLDYLPSETVGRTNVFLPTCTVFEAGSSFINQEGRVQHARQAHVGGISLWGDPQPPRTFSDRVPGGEHKPAWQALADIAAAMDPSRTDFPADTPARIVAAEHERFSTFEQGIYPVDGVRVLPEDVAECFSSRPAGGPCCSVRFRGAFPGRLAVRHGGTGRLFRHRAADGGRSVPSFERNGSRRGRPVRRRTRSSPFQREQPGTAAAHFGRGGPGDGFHAPPSQAGLAEVDRVSRNDFLGPDRKAVMRRPRERE